MVNDLLSVHFYVVFIFWMSYEYELSFFFFFGVCIFSWEKAMVPHSSTLAWKSQWREEPGRLQSTGRYELGMTE